MGQLVFQAALGGAVNLIGPNISATTNFTLPGADGTNGQALTTNGSGVLGFSSIVSGAAGSNTQIQFNSGGNFGASSSLTWDGSTFSTTGLSASGSVTLSGGTANGVTYLNGSKVLTSGSALTFDGTNLLLGNTASTGLSTGQLQVGTASVSDSAIQMLSNTTGTSGVYFGDGTTGGDRYRGAIEYANNGDILRFYSGSSAQLNLTSTSLYTASGINVGIGTSSPAHKLQVSGAIYANNSTNVAFLMQGSQYNGSIANTSTANTYSLGYTTDTTTHSSVLYWNASGNLGLGVTPSAWRSTTKALQVGSGTSLQNFDNTGTVAASLGSNFYFNSSDQAIYLQSYAASSYVQVNGQHIWNTAASGTAGAVASFTQAMSLTASGDLLVGKTSVGASNTGFQVNSIGEITVSNSATTNAGATQLNVYSTGASAYRFFVGMGGTVYATSTTITAISDQRLKENIRDLDDGLDVVMALKPRKFDWKDGKGQNIKNARGFIAQEFETVLPDMIEAWRDPAPKGEEPYKAINANLIPTLVKAIQELKMEFDAYKAAHP